MQRLQLCSSAMSPARARGLSISRAASSLPNVAPVLNAPPRSPKGFGFSAGGLVFPYFIGVMYELKAAGLMNDNTPVAGASAGSLIAASCHAGITEWELTEATLALARDCRRGGTRFRLRSVLENTLREVLPLDVHVRCSGKVHVAVTHLLPNWKPELISEYESRDDLIQSLLTSCHIPWYFNGDLATKYRSNIAFDGGITNFIPLPPGTSKRSGLRICCFPARNMKVFGPIGIAPDLYEEWPYSLQQMLAWALEPASEDMLRYLIDKGKRDTRAWASAAGHASVSSSSASTVATMSNISLGSSISMDGASSSLDGSSLGSSAVAAAAAAAMGAAAVGAERRQAVLVGPDGSPMPPAAASRAR